MAGLLVSLHRARHFQARHFGYLGGSSSGVRRLALAFTQLLRASRSTSTLSRAQVEELQLAAELASCAQSTPLPAPRRARLRRSAEVAGAATTSTRPARLAAITPALPAEVVRGEVLLAAAMLSERLYQRRKYPAASAEPLLDAEMEEMALLLLIMEDER